MNSFENNLYQTNEFLKNFSFVDNNKIHYYSSPLLKKNKFKHAFFTKESSKIDINLKGNKILKNKHNNCYLKQIHSNNIVYTSTLNKQKLALADGLICDNKNQNLWIYTADCMPILIADKYQRRIAAIHCGRKGLEKNIISNTINKFEIMGTCKRDLLVAIGPSISGDNYLLDKKAYYNFRSINNILLSKTIKKNIALFDGFNEDEFISLDIKEYAYLQLVSKEINPTNIDISNKCTYSLNNEFHSWRRSKKNYRQWSVICS